MTYVYQKGHVSAPFVSEAQAAEFLKLETGDYDRDQLTGVFIPAATERVEDAVGHPLDGAVWILPLKPPPNTTTSWKTTVPLPDWPGIVDTNISVSPAGTAVVVDDEIVISNLPEPGSPALAQSSYRTPTLSISAGEGAGPGFPRARLLVLRIAAHLNEHRGDMDSPLPRDIEADLASIGPFRGF